MKSERVSHLQPRYNPLFRQPSGTERNGRYPSEFEGKFCLNSKVGHNFEDWGIYSIKILPRLTSLSCLEATLDNFVEYWARSMLLSKNKLLNWKMFVVWLEFCCISLFVCWAKFPHSPIHHYTSIYGALLFSVSPVRCTCIIKYGAVRKFFRMLFQWQYLSFCAGWNNVICWM